MTTILPNPLKAEILCKYFFSLLLTTGLSIISTGMNAQNALSFDGVNDYIDCGNHSSVNLVGNTITLEAWIYPTSFKPNFWEGNVINKDDATSPHGYMLRVGNGGEVNFNIGTGSWNEITSAPGAVSLNTWHHIAGTYDGSIMRLYVDGVLAVTGTLTANIGSTSRPLYIGEDPQYNNRHFPGKIEEVRIWSDARTAAEINQYMHSEFCDSTGLIAWYHFDQGLVGGNNITVTIANDELGNSNGTLTNFALSSTTSNWTSGVFISDNTGIDTQTACSAYTWIDGNTYTMSNNTATHTIVGGASNGCDSTVTLDLTIAPSVTSTDVQIACSPFTWIDGNTYSASNNSATFTYTGATANGCDSVVTLNLSYLPNVTGTDTQTAVLSYTWIDGNIYTSSNNTATYTIVGGGVNGCDSVVSLDLTILSPNGQNSLQFDGVNDYVDCGNDPSINLVGTSISLEAWIYPTAFRPNVWQGNIINKGDATNDNGYMLRVGNNGQVNFNIGSGSWNEINSPVGAVTLNNWHHVAGTYDGTTMRIYVDGNQVAMGALTANIGSTSHPLFLGEDPQWNNRHFPGRIEEVRIWDDARTSAEINQYMNSEFCDTNNLVAWYQFNHGIPAFNNARYATLSDVLGINNGFLLNFALDSTNSNWMNGRAIGNNTSTDIRSACDTYTWIDGNTYTSSNNSAIFRITGAAANGCDSLVFLDLTIDTVDVSAVINGTTITANATGAKYQWLECLPGNSYTVLSADTNQSFNASPGQSYAVEITQNNCIDTSACFTLLNVGIEEVGLENLTLYPNPTTDFTTLDLGTKFQEINIETYSLQGKRINVSTAQNVQKVRVNLGEAKGIYLLRIQADDQLRFIKVSKH